MTFILLPYKNLHEYENIHDSNVNNVSMLIMYYYSRSYQFKKICYDHFINCLEKFNEIHQMVESITAQLELMNN